nr:hypothetical protein [Tanacetum cinerariifolium]
MSKTFVANDTSGLVPQRQKASDYEKYDPVPQLQNVSSSADAHVPSHQELDLLFGPLYDEFFTTGTSSFNKSSSPTNNSNQQDTQPTTNIQPTLEPSTPTYVHAKENNDNQEEEEHLHVDEFTNQFYTPVQEVANSSSHNIGNSNVHTFNQPQVFEYLWTKDNPLEQVRRNPSNPVQTRRQLAIDHEMCMLALTVSTAEPKNIKEAIADSAWIEAVQEEFHQFERLQVWELIDKPFGKTIIRLKWLWKNKKDEDQTEEVYVAQPEGFVDPDHPEKVEESSIRPQTSSTSMKHGLDDCVSMSTPMATERLDTDLQGIPTDQTNYHRMIGGLVYLTSSRPDIAFATFVCARDQARPTVKHLKETQTMQDVKMIAKTL